MLKNYCVYVGIIAFLLIVTHDNLSESISLAQPSNGEQEITIATTVVGDWNTFPVELWSVDFKTKKATSVTHIEQIGTIDTRNNIPSEALFELQTRLLDNPLTYTRNIYLDVSPPRLNQLQLSPDQQTAILLETVDYRLRLTDPPDCRVITCAEIDVSFMSGPNETGIQRLVSHNLNVKRGGDKNHLQVLTRWREEGVRSVRSSRYLEQLDWSPDGRYVSFFEKTGDRHHFSGIYKNKLHILDIQTNDIITVTQGIGLNRSAWLSDSQTILIEIDGFLFSDEIDTIHFRVCDVSTQSCQDTDTGLVRISRWEWHADLNRGVAVIENDLYLFNLCVEDSLCNQIPMEKIPFDISEIISKTQLSGLPVDFIDLQWSPSGKLLLLGYRNVARQLSGIIILNPDSGEVVYHYSTSHYQSKFCA